MPNVQGVGQTTVSPGLPRVNLMPPEIEAAAKFRRFQLVMGAALAGAVVIVGGLYMHGKSAVSDAQSQLDAAQAQHTVLQSKLASLSSVQDVYTQVASKQAMLQSAMAGEIRWSYYLNDLSLKMPDNVWLTSVAATESASPGASSTAASAANATSVVPTGIGTITFAGTAFSHDDVATWLDVLAREKGYLDPYFSNSTETKIGERKVVNFSSSVVLSDAAKSGRYATPAGS
jgi:Tfp pilus assembly protein PilN